MNAKPLISVVMLSMFFFGCAEYLVHPASVHPASDPQNTGNWVLRADLSDEFEGNRIDSDKWYVSRADGKHEWTWKGRRPSQFVPENAIVEDGKLKLRTKWEPEYDLKEGLKRFIQWYGNYGPEERMKLG